MRQISVTSTIGWHHALRAIERMAASETGDDAQRFTEDEAKRLEAVAANVRRIAQRRSGESI